jgi:hypothetical protein
MTTMPRERLIPRSIPLLLLIFAVLAPRPLPVRAAEKPAAEAAAKPAVKALDPVAAAIEELRGSTADRLAELEATRSSALGTEAALALDRQIAGVKLDFELGVLRLQLDEQKALGRNEAVEELTTSMDALEKLRDEVGGPRDQTPTPVATPDEGESQ